MTYFMNGNHLKSHTCARDTSEFCGLLFSEKGEGFSYREEFEVAVADDVEQVKAEEIDVKHCNACAANSPSSQQGNSKVGSVHQVLHERVY